MTSPALRDSSAALGNWRRRMATGAKHVGRRMVIGGIFVLTVVAASCSWPDNTATPGDGRVPVAAEPSWEDEPARPTDAAGDAASAPAPKAEWIRDVEEACDYALVMYPSLRLGSRAEVDTMDYGFRDFYSSLSRIPPPADQFWREVVDLLMAHGRDVSAMWHELALRPPLLFAERDAGGHSSVSVAEKRAAAQETQFFILGLADAGAAACSPLAPAE